MPEANLFAAAALTGHHGRARALIPTVTKLPRPVAAPSRARSPRSASTDGGPRPS